MKKEIQKVKDIRRLRKQLKTLRKEFDKDEEEEKRLKIRLERKAVEINNMEFELSKLIDSL